MPQRGAQKPNPLSKPPFVTVRNPGMGGMMTKGDPQDLKDDESPQMLNTSFDSGVIGPRFGTTLALAAPVGETGVPSQMLKTKDSNGVTYIVAVFGTNFYLFDPLTPQWIKLNGSYSPSKSGLFYGSASWNLGTGRDAFYFGNGVDYVMRWNQLLASLSAAAASSDTKLSVSDASQFPANGSLLINGNVVSYGANGTGGTLNMLVQPANNDEVTIDVNFNTINVQFVNSIGSAPGNVLIGATVAASLANLLGLLQNPTVTSSTQVALSTPNAALISDFTFTSPTSSSILFTPTSAVYALTVPYVQTAGNYFTLTNPLNVLGINGTVGYALPSGARITTQIVSVPAIPQGNVLAIATAGAGSNSPGTGPGSRLFVAGVNGNENMLYYSTAYTATNSSSPQENFGEVTQGTPSTLDGSGTPGTNGGTPIIYGEGGILDIQDFGSYLAIIKDNSIVQAAFYVDTTNDTSFMVCTPAIFGESIFPVGQQTDLTIENALLITTPQGIYQFTPSSTGAQLTTTLTPFSDNILSFFQKGSLSFSNGRMEFLNRLLFVLCSSIPGVNDLVLVNDFVWGNNWTMWNNLNAVDVKESGGMLYFLCNDDGGLYYYDQTSFQDFRKGNPIGYETDLYTKRYDWGESANPKTQSMAMVQGYITQNTKLYCDILYNEGGSLALSTYIIDGSNTDYVSQVPIYTPGRVSLGQNPLGGAQVGTIGVFRVYLDLLNRIGAHVIQAHFYTSNPGDQWGITEFAANPEVNEQIPTELKLGIS